ncbi:hypothetical protein [Limosilactobacillus sp.]|uniref:hypothetical protein n=1 Tax=Limosilactobacillus sp. TaxID=2773925 RepID=UPI003F08D8E9
MQTFTQPGIFINHVSSRELTKLAQRGQDGLILDEQLVAALEAGSWHLPAGVNNRIVLPVHGRDQTELRQRAEKLTLCGENVWVQVPVMTAGQFNQSLIAELLAEGVPLVVDGVASKQQVYHLLTIARETTTPLLMIFCPAMSRYDAIVGLALAHLLSQVQVISPVRTVAEYWLSHNLQFDGVIVNHQQLTALHRLVASAAGQTCNVHTHQEYELVLG